MSASTWPGPTEGSWSTSPTMSKAALSGTALSVYQWNIDHRRFVDDQQVAVERVPGITLEASGLRVNLEQAVDGLGLMRRRLAQALGSASGRGAQQGFHAFGGQ